MPLWQRRASFFLILCLPCELPCGLLLTLPTMRTCDCPCVCGSKFWCRQISQEKWIGIITSKPQSWKVGLCEVDIQIGSHLDTVINLRCWMLGLPLVQSLPEMSPRLPTMTRIPQCLRSGVAASLMASELGHVSNLGQWNISKWNMHGDLLGTYSLKCVLLEYSSSSSFFLREFLFNTYLFLAAPDLSCSTQDLSFWPVGISLVVAHGLYNCGAWTWLPCSMWDLSSPTGDWIHVPCIRRQILNYWTAREVPECSFLETGYHAM